YRRAFVLNALFTPDNYDRLDHKAKKRANKEVFGQEEPPEFKTDAFKTGAEKIAHIRKTIRIGRGESFATASPRPEEELTYREVMGSKDLDQNSKTLYKELHDKGLLSREEERLLRKLGKD